ncbi:MAG: glycosyltransferase [Crocinitomicaceae bacterium]
MAAKKVLILIGIPNFDFENPHSAVLAYLKTIKKAFEKKGCSVTFSQVQNAISNEKANQASGESFVKSVLKNILKKFPFIYHSLSLKAYFKGQKNLFEQLKLKERPDLIVEFHTIGSTMGRDLSNHWNCDFSMVFDAPTDEQFFEMHGTKTLYWKKIGLNEGLSIKAAKRVIVYSGACSKYISEKYKPSAEISVLPCVIAKEKVKRNVSDQFTIGFIGSFLKWHKVEQLVIAFSEFVKRVPQAKLELIGKGEEWGNVKQKVMDLELTESVNMPGFVSEQELIRLKSLFSVAIMPGSNWYGSPLKLFEYGEAGIPFIAPDTATVKSIFIEKKHCCFLDDENLIPSIIHELDYLHDNRIEAESMGLRVQKYVVKKFDSEKYNEKLFVNLNVIDI